MEKEKKEAIESLLYHCVSSKYRETEAIGHNGGTSNIYEERARHRVNMIKSRTALNAIGSHRISLAIRAST